MSPLGYLANALQGHICYDLTVYHMAEIEISIIYM